MKISNVYSLELMEESGLFIIDISINNPNVFRSINDFLDHLEKSIRFIQTLP